MTPEEKNRLICKFMGYESIGKNYVIRNSDNIFEGNYSMKEMKFDVSFDWQMDVLMKIRRMGFHFQIGQIGEENATAIIKHPQLEDKISISTSNYSTLPNIIYEVIVKWIEWYYNIYIKHIIAEKIHIK